MPERDLDDVISAAAGHVRRGDFGDLASLGDRLLSYQDGYFLGTYLKGIATIGLGDQDTGRTYLKNAEKIVPALRRFNFLHPLQRHRRAAEPEILLQRLVSMLQFEAIDVFLLSYPKCGRTWLRFMLGVYALCGKPGDPLEVTAISDANPDLSTVEVSHDDYPHWKPCADIVTDKSAYQGKQVVFLARDPRDVMVSYYFQYTLRGDKERANDAGFDGDLAAFIRHDIGGLKSLVHYYNAWAAARHTPASFRLVTYEDLHADPRKELKAVIDFLGWPDYGPMILDQALSAGSFENMQRLEAGDVLGNVRLRPPQDNNPEGFKVRRGVVGGFADYLTEEDIRWMEDYIDLELDEFFARYKYYS